MNTKKANLCINCDHRHAMTEYGFNVATKYCKAHKTVVEDLEVACDDYQHERRYRRR